MGKKISNILKGEIVSSIFYIALGLCLILIPDQTVNIICKVIFGLIMIAAGVYHVAIYVAEKEKATILDLFTGVITVVLGVFLFFTPQIVIKILPYLLGAFVLVDSFWKLKGTHRLRRAETGMWKVFLVGSLVFILLGIAVMFYPFISVTKMILFCGCILTADGVVDLVFLVMQKLGLKKAEKRRQQQEDEKKITEPEPAAVKEDIVQQSTEEERRGKRKISLKKRKMSESTAENTDLDEADSDRADSDVAENAENAGKENITVKDAAVKNMPEEDAAENGVENAVTSGKMETMDLSSGGADLELETEKTAEAADADKILENKDRSQTDSADLESPNREIQEMLRNHEEPLEEWKD